MGQMSERAFVTRMAVAVALVAGCWGDAGSPSTKVTCVASPTISGDLRPRWDQVLGHGYPGMMRLRPDGSLLITGLTDAPMLGGTGLGLVGFATAMDRDGKIIWLRRFRQGFLANDVSVDSDGSAYLVGSAGSGTPVDFGRGPVTGAVAVKLAPDGSTTYSFSIVDDLRGLGINEAYGLRIAAASSGAFAIAGTNAGSKRFLAWYDAASSGLLDGRVTDTAANVSSLAFDNTGGLLVVGQLGTSLQPQTLDWGPTALSATSSAFAVYFDQGRRGVWARTFGEQTTATALAMDGSRALLAGTFSDTLVLDGATLQARGFSDLMVLSIDDLTSPHATARALTTITAGRAFGTADATAVGLGPFDNDDRIMALAPDGAGGVVAFANVLSYLSVGDLAVPPMTELLLRLNSAGQPVAHAILPSSQPGMQAKSVARDAQGTYVFGTFTQAINLGGSTFRAIDTRQMQDGLFLAAFGPEPAALTSVPCPLPPGALVDYGVAFSPARLALAGETIVAADETAIFTLPASGGPSRLLASGQRGISSLSVSGDRIIWTTQGKGVATQTNAQGSVMMMPLAGGTPVVLAAGEDSPRGVAASGANVYWTVGGLNYQGGASVQITGSLRAVPVTGGAPTVLASGFSWVSPVVAASSGFVVFAGGTGSAKGKIFRVATQDGVAVEIAEATQVVTSLAVDDATVYWTEGLQTTDGSIRSAPLAGGETTLLASSVVNPRDIAVVDGLLYWAEGGSRAWRYDDFNGARGATIRWTAAKGDVSVVDLEEASLIGPLAVGSPRLVWTAYDANRWLLRTRDLLEAR